MTDEDPFATPADDATLIEHKDQILYGSSTLPATFEIDGEPVQLGTIVAAAFEASGLTEAAWNDLPEAERDEKLHAELDKRGYVAPEPHRDPTDLSISPDTEKAKEANGEHVVELDHPDATEGQPVTNPIANQTPMAKPVTAAPAFAGPDNDAMPTPAEQAAPTESTEPLKGIEVDGPSPVLGAPIGVNPIVPQAVDVAKVSATYAETHPDLPDQMTGIDVVVPMSHPEGGSTDLFDAHEDGRILVPADQVEDMKAHGFVVDIDDEHPIEEA